MIKFLVAGALNTLFGYAVYAVLLFAELPYLFALLIATVVGVGFNYISFGRIAFNGHVGRFVFGRFIVAYTIIYIANAISLRILMTDSTFNAYLGQMICIPISVLLSWLLMNYWVYKNDSPNFDK